MEQQQRMKRERERDDETHKEYFGNNKAKKRDVSHIKFMKDVKKGKEDCSSETWESNLAFGVFDFPWLKDGVTSKSEDYLLDFEDNFSSLLEEDSFFKTANIDFSQAYMAHIPESKLEDIAWQPFENDISELEAEDVDCIWSSLLKQPLQP